MGKREETLVSRPPPRDEAPWAATARLKADLDAGMRSLPSDMEKMLFMAVCMGGSSLRTARKDVSCRRAVADYWGITAGEVSAIVAEAEERICRTLNGDARGLA